MKQIYTPTKNNPFTGFNKGDKVTVKTKHGEYKAIVTHFPCHSRFDTDFRMSLRAENKGKWFGEMVISAENNWYGQHHISEVVLTKNATA